MARLVFVFVLLALTIPIYASQVWAQDPRNLAETAIVSARNQLHDSSQRIQSFWQNVTDPVRTDVAGDLIKSYDNLFVSMREFDASFYNDSTRFARLSRFFAARAEYRVFLNLAWTMIIRANDTIASIPTDIPKPQYAKELLTTANSTYWKCHYGWMLEVQGGDVGEYEVNNMLAAEKMLFSNPESAFNYASKAMRNAESYRATEEVKQRKSIQEINSQFNLAFTVVFFFAAVASVYSIRPIILGLARRTERGRRRLDRQITSAFRQFARELEKKSNLDILLRTCGALLSTVASLLVILYILNSIYASRGMIINIGFAMTVLGGLLGPVIVLALSLVCGVLARFSGAGRIGQIVAFVSF